MAIADQKARQRSHNIATFIAVIAEQINRALRGGDYVRTQAFLADDPKALQAIAETRQGCFVLGFDPDDLDTLKDLRDLGDRALDDPCKYDNRVWFHFCDGALSYNEIAACREVKTKVSSRPRFFRSPIDRSINPREWRKFIDTQFEGRVCDRGGKPAKAPR